MKVLHVSPHSLGDGKSVWGGGERYPIELARAMARYVPVTLLTFGPQAKRESAGDLSFEVLRPSTLSTKNNPWRGAVVEFVSDADIVHCHQYRYASTDLAFFFAKILRKKVVLTDHGGGAPGFARLVRYSSLFDGYAPVSRYSERDLGLENPRRGVRPKVILYGGGWVPEVNARSGGDRVLFVGRITPHKGIEVLIGAAGRDIPVDIVGSIGHEVYYEHLRGLARDSQVQFHTNVSDVELARFHREAYVLVLPTVPVDMYGRRHRRPELLGLVLIQSMLYGVPVVASEIGGLPELIRPSETGFTFPCGDIQALRAILVELRGDRRRRAKMSEAARKISQNEYTWDVVAKRALRLYNALLHQ